MSEPKRPLPRGDYEDLSFNQVIALFGIAKQNRGPMPYGFALFKDGVELTYNDCGGCWKWLRENGYIV